MALSSIAAKLSAQPIPQLWVLESVAALESFDSGHKLRRRIPQLRELNLMIDKSPLLAGNTDAPAKVRLISLVCFPN